MLNWKKINEFEEQKSMSFWVKIINNKKVKRFDAQICFFFLNHQNNSVKYTTSSYSPSVFSNIRQKKEINPDDGIFGVE